MKAYFQLIRVHQWSKNLFLLVPAFFAQHLPQGTEWLTLFAGFLAFSLAASTIYIVNDARDVEEDKLHPKKRFRPIASGAIGVKSAYLMAAAQLAIIGLAALWLPLDFSLVLATYFIMNMAYSLGLKKVALLDISIIAFGFILRILAGGALLDILISKWLVLTTFLLALLLALGKRRDDVLILNQSGQAMRKSIKGYNLPFIDGAVILLAGVTVVCYMMYTISPEITARMHSDKVYLTSLFVVLGILRYLQIVFVEQNSGFPTQILLKDRFIQLVLLAWVSSFGMMLYF